MENELQKMIKELVSKTDKEKETDKGLTVQYVSLELYPDTDSYNCELVLKKIKDFCRDHNSQYVIMLHDSDIYTKDTYKNRVLVGKKGQPKKPHYHCLISLPYRRHLSDLSIAFGVEDRWILKLKKDIDFDNMIVYLTHIRCPEKKYYSPDKYDTNIKEYCLYLYNLAEENMEKEQYSIVSYFIHLLNEVDHKINYQTMFKWLSQEYSLKAYQKSYKILSDLLIEHNRQFEMITINERLADKNRMLIDENAKLQKNLDVIIDENLKLRGIEDSENNNVFDKEE